MSEAVRWVGAFETHTVMCDITHGMTHDVTQVSEAARWVEFFETHDKYTRVGGVAAAEPIDLDEVRVAVVVTSYPGWWGRRWWRWRRRHVSALRVRSREQRRRAQHRSNDFV